jgi:hypothetical protein
MIINLMKMMLNKNNGAPSILINGKPKKIKK